MPKKGSVFNAQGSIFSLGCEPLPDWLIYTKKTTKKKVVDFIQKWQSCKMFALDLETFPLVDEPDAALDPWRGEIRTIQIGLQDGTCLVVDLGGNGDNREEIYKKLDKVGFWNVLVERVGSKQCRTVGHNLLFDLLYLLYKYDITANCVGDSFLLSKILWAGLPKHFKHDLGSVGARLGIEIDKTEQKSNWFFNLSNSQILYAANDVKQQFDVYVTLGKEAQKQNLLNSVNAEFMALPAFVEMMRWGMPVDEELLDSLLTQYEEAFSTVSKPFMDRYGEYGLSCKSTAFKEALEVNHGISFPRGESNKKDSEGGMNKDNLNPHRNIPEVASLLDARTLKTYLDYLKGVKSGLREGAIRGGYQQLAAKGIGRSCSGGEGTAIPSVNLQNPPNPSKANDEIKALGLPPVRTIFKAPKGYCFGATDYSAAHARIACEATQDSRFIASYNEGVDVHCLVASEIAQAIGKNWSEEQIGKIRKQKDADGSLATSLRNVSKNVFYGWLNGAGKAKTEETIRIGDFTVYRGFGGHILGILGEAFPGIKQFHEFIKQELKTNKIEFDGLSLPYTWVTSISGRRVYMPIFPPKENGYGGAKPSEGLMNCWMTVESDAKKMALGLCRNDAMEFPEWGFRIVNDCHDEIVWVCKEEYFDTCSKFVWDRMMATMGYFVKSIKPYEEEWAPSPKTYSWAECK